MRDGRCTFKILTGKPFGKIPLERPKALKEDYIELILKIEWSM